MEKNMDLKNYLIFYKMFIKTYKREDLNYKLCQWFVFVVKKQ